MNDRPNAPPDDPDLGNDTGHTEHTVELTDGRSLGVAEWGPKDAAPVIYCHGSPGTRLEPAMARPMIERSRTAARLVALDRPGFGRSTPQPGRRFLDWPTDVAQAADHLGLDTFAVLGASGGCPFTLACGLRLGDRVTRIGIVAGAGPLEAPGMAEAPMIAGAPRVRAIRRLRWEVIARLAGTNRVERLIDRAATTMAGIDRAAMEQPDIRRWYRRVFIEAMTQGGAATALEEDLFLQGWGFDLHEVETEIHLWHGDADRWVPSSVARWLADHLPNAELDVWPRHGHFSWAASLEAAEVVAALVGSEGGGGLVPDLGEPLDGGDNGEDQHDPEHGNEK